MLRSVPGSGYHDNDPTGPLKAPSEEDRKSARIDEHCVVFRKTFEMVFCDACAEQVSEAIRAFAAEHAAELDASRVDQEWRTLVETALEYSSMPLVNDCLLIRSQQWNVILAVLTLQGIGVTTTA